jgi:small subunit ribosomal protein S4
MGQPKFPRKQYDSPLHPWKEERIKQERELIKKYGLKNHKEVWRAKTFLGKYRQQARELLGKMGSRDPQIKREGDQLLFHLTRMGILPLGSSLDDVLALETESVLSRRLQTLVYLKGFSGTATQSRQLINHGHVRIGDRKVTIPGYLVTKDEEEFIGYTSKSPLNELSHPARPKSDIIRTEIEPKGTDEKTQKPTKETAQPKPAKPTETTPVEPPKGKPEQKTPQTEQPKEISKPDETAPPQKEKEPEPTPQPPEPTPTQPKIDAAKAETKQSSETPTQEQKTEPVKEEKPEPTPKETKKPAEEKPKKEPVEEDKKEA